MANIKQYTIQINGIQESINGVDKLNKQLNTLEERINKLSSSKVGVSSSGGSSKANLSEEEKISRQIEAIDAKRVAYSKQVYQNYLAAKEVLKETVSDQKQIAAQERLQASSYSNTMMGMKQELADIKAVMQTVDLGDGDTFKKMTDRANELNNKLLEIEKSYGQFGRNVGNYADATKGLQSIIVSINGVEREFGNAREATRTLNNELKAMAVQGKENTKEYSELRQKLLELESTLNDAKKPMDGILDTMQSFTAIASVSKGFGAFFGIDSTEIQKSIQQLMALQTALKGLQTIAKQVETREGVGKWIAPFTTSIDKATAKLLVFNRAILGTSKAAKLAATGIKAFGTALKAALSAGILIAIDLAIEGVMKLVDTFKSSKQEITDVKKVMEEGADAYAHAEATLTKYQFKIENFNGTKKQEKKLVEELNSKLGDSIGNYKSIAEWQDALIKKGPAYLQLMRLQALYQAAINQYAAQYIKLATGQAGGKELLDNTVLLKNMAEGFLKEADELSKKYKIGDYSDNIKDNGKKNKDAVKEAEKELAQARISAMKDGLLKTITQLEEERKQRLNKLDKNLKNYKSLEKEINDIYDVRILNAQQEWAKKMEESNKNMWTTILQDDIKNRKKELEIIQGKYDNLDKKELEDEFFKQGIGGYGLQTNDKKVSDEIIDNVRQLVTYQNQIKAIEAKLEAERDTMLPSELFFLTRKLNMNKIFYQELYEQYGKYLTAIKDLDEDYSSSLALTFNQRESAVNAYWYVLAQKSEEATKLIYGKRKAIITGETQSELDETIKHYSKLEEEENDAYDKQLEGYQGLLSAQTISQEEYNFLSEELAEKHAKKLEEIEKNNKDAINNIEVDEAYKITELDKWRNGERQKLNKEFYENQMQEIRDFQTAITNLESQPEIVNAWGITNLSAEKRKTKEVIEAYETMAKKLINVKKNLKDYYRDGVIDRDTYEKTLREIDVFLAAVYQKTQEAKNKLTFNEQFDKIAQGAMQYVQAIGQGLQQIMSAVWSAQDTQFDNESRYLDKLNEELDKKLDEQQAIVEKHKDAIDDIEDELASARGDRRQHLIDQLNAQITAQRAAAQEEKRLQKQKEALEKKQEDLDWKRQEAQYKRELAQILVSGALAAINAYATKPFLPTGLAMGSLALGITAAQYAIAKSNPPKRYANGGLLEGKSHANGGIPVGNTGVEVEGNEYVVNKATTMQNIDLLEYINSNRRRLNISDLIDFYSSDAPRRTIQGIRNKFADGGVLPSISNVDVKGQLQNVVAVADNRPIWVSVKDINDRQAAVRNVQVLAGMSN